MLVKKKSIKSAKEVYEYGVKLCDASKVISYLGLAYSRRLIDATDLDAGYVPTLAPLIAVTRFYPEFLELESVIDAVEEEAD